MARDCKPKDHDDIRELMREVTARERLRVLAACLKVGGGDFNKLKGALLHANGWWREIISEAEHPRMKKSGTYSDAEIHEKQKQHYLRWFHGE